MRDFPLTLELVRISGEGIKYSAEEIAALPSIRTLELESQITENTTMYCSKSATLRSFRAYSLF